MVALAIALSQLGANLAEAAELPQNEVEMVLSPFATSTPVLVGPGRQSGEAYNPSNCYSYAEWRLGVDLPAMTDIFPNATATVGSLAVFQYPVLKHIAVVESISKEGVYVSEANYNAGEYGERFVYWDDAALLGFWR